MYVPLLYKRQFGEYMRILVCTNKGKSEECQCGCHGWCTYYPMHETLRWDINGSAHGFYQELGPFELPFGPENEWYKKRAGQKLKAIPVTVEHRSDWPAWTQHTGMRNWNHNIHPCPCCRVTRKDLLKLSRIRLHCNPFGLYKQNDYDLEADQHSLVAREIRGSNHS